MRAAFDRTAIPAEAWLPAHAEMELSDCSREIEQSGRERARSHMPSIDFIPRPMFVRAARRAQLYTSVLITVLDVLLIVHAARTGRFMPWGFVILFLPGVGALVYVAFALAPEWFGSYGAQRARRSIAAALDPTGRYRALRDELDLVDTIANRSALAEECLKHRQAAGGARALRGDPGAAARRRTGFPDRQGARAARARARRRSGRDARGGPTPARRTSIRPTGIFSSPARSSRPGGPTRRSTLTPAFRARFPGPEPRVREARLLERLGRRDQARSIAEEVVRSLRRAPRHVQANEREWFALARELAR